jgi:hypothetical protein
VRQPLQAIMIAYEWLARRLNTTPTKNIWTAAGSRLRD